MFLSKEERFERHQQEVVKSGALSTQVAVGAGLAVAAGASQAALDFTGVTGAIDATTIVAAITAVAAIKILPGVAKWGFNKVIGWFRG
ncbi:hypothetical protein ACH50O_02975 [Methylomonas sp. 2BW1-5-20]|uniref:hypothetical protein n=1 Tax=Methylomonas sp. 2BW1-5-20 TaxID=3376686 RepID=UPI00404BE7E5